MTEFGKLTLLIMGVWTTHTVDQLSVAEDCQAQCHDAHWWLAGQVACIVRCTHRSMAYWTLTYTSFCGASKTSQHVEDQHTFGSASMVSACTELSTGAVAYITPHHQTCVKSHAEKASHPGQTLYTDTLLMQRARKQAMLSDRKLAADACKARQFVKFR